MMDGTGEPLDAAGTFKADPAERARRRSVASVGRGGDRGSRRASEPVRALSGAGRCLRPMSFDRNSR